MRASGQVIIGILAIAVGGSDIDAQGPGYEAFEPSLEFTEEHRWTAPVGYDVSGLGFAPEGMVVWARESPRVFHLDRELRDLREFNRPGGADVKAVALDSLGVLHVLLGGPARLLRREPDGRRVEADTLALEGRLVFGDFDGSRWVLAAATADGESSVRILSVSVTEGILGPVTELASGGFAAPVIFAHEGQAYVTETRRPHTVTVFSGDTRTARGAPPAGLLDSLSIAAQAGPADAWNAVRALPLDSGLVQTLADPTSQWRVLVIYDARTRPKRNPILRGPFAFVRSDPRAQLISAIRRLNRIEVVQYRWRWRRRQ